MAHPNVVHQPPPLPEDKRLLHTSESILSAALSRFPITPTPPDRRLHSIPPLATTNGAVLFQCVLKRPTVEWLYLDGHWLCGAESMKETFARELRLLRTVKPHVNIVGFLGVVDELGLLIEKIDGVSLETRLYSGSPTSLHLKIYWVNQIIDALCHVHSFSLCHGDISLGNVLITAENTIKLIDFGNSAKNGERVYPSTVPFEAPEIRQSSAVDPILADAYAFGVLALFIDANLPRETTEIKVGWAIHFSALVLRYVQPVQTRARVHISHRLPETST
ncbi:kinase-like protein [Rickenella mellea]|uniref:Kinase-like protein n=1 Tax=Rickenella mellea TaxID=50990 RepID=A0A4Y7PU72_9AGAM|nr:kinase-like protein [Rickenella mellea]